MKKSVAIIGGGTAGLFAAAFLDADRYEVTIYEKKASVGRKFLVAGDGGFNLTHSEEIDDFIERYTPDTFLAEALRSFSNADFIEWLHVLGIPTFIGSSKRVFPEKGIKPIEVLNKITDHLKDKNVQFKFKQEFTGWTEEGNLIFNNKYLEENLIYLVLVDRHEICEFKRDNKGEILSVSCSKPSGFAKILEHDHNAIFIAKQDYNHRKILPHEFGHFFGLFHTHEKVFGEDDINNTHQSQTMGDLISDTPVDPGINGYVNYSSCRYDDFIQPSTGMKYQPMIENYMSYYEPCYMREYKFTPEQVRRMSTAASGPYRFHLAKQRGI